MYLIACMRSLVKQYYIHNFIPSSMEIKTSGTYTSVALNSLKRSVMLSDIETKIKKLKKKKSL